MKNWLKTGTVVLAAASLVTGCFGGGTGGKETLKTMGKDEKATIKVMYYDERSLFSQYGSLFLAKYPNIDIQVVSTQSIKYEPGKDMNKAYEAFIDEQQPDVLMLSSDNYEKLAANGKLYELDSVIGQDKFDIGNILPSVTDYLKAKGGGKLYGLAPNFYSQALFYNKDLFAKYGVPEPKDQMSWEELFELARRFPTTGDEKERVYGFMMNAYSDNLYDTATSVGAAKGLNILDPENKKMTIDTESWRNVFKLVFDTVKSGAIYRPKPDDNQMRSFSSEEDFLLRDPFVAGKVAMTMNGSYQLDQLKQAKTALKDRAFNWDVVTMPVDPQNPNAGTGLNVSQIFAVNAKSANTRAAWEFVKYINGDEFARVMSKSSMNGMYTRAAYIKDAEGHHLEAFYKLKMSDNEMYKGYDKLPQTFFQSFMGIAEQETKDAYDGKKTVEDALKAMQEKGQQTLMSAAEQQKQDDAKQAESTKAEATKAESTKAESTKAEAK